MLGNKNMTLSYLESVKNLLTNKKNKLYTQKDIIIRRNSKKKKKKPVSR